MADSVLDRVIALPGKVGQFMVRVVAPTPQPLDYTRGQGSAVYDGLLGADGNIKIVSNSGSLLQTGRDYVYSSFGSDKTVGIPGRAAVIGKGNRAVVAPAPTNYYDGMTGADGRINVLSPFTPAPATASPGLSTRKVTTVPVDIYTGNPIRSTPAEITVRGGNSIVAPTPFSRPAQARIAPTPLARPVQAVVNAVKRIVAPTPAPSRGVVIAAPAPRAESGNLVSNTLAALAAAVSIPQQSPTGSAAGRALALQWGIGAPGETSAGSGGATAAEKAQEIALVDARNMAHEQLINAVRSGQRESFTSDDTDALVARIMGR